MKSISVAEFESQCLKILDHVPAEGLNITKEGKVVATLYPAGHINEKFMGTVPKLNTSDDLFTTGIQWEAES